MDNYAKEAFIEKLKENIPDNCRGFYFIGIVDNIDEKGEAHISLSRQLLDISPIELLGILQFSIGDVLNQMKGNDSPKVEKILYQKESK